jgi:hypothetical protein
MKPKMLIPILTILLLLACNAPFNVGIESPSSSATAFDASTTTNVTVEPSATNTVAAGPLATFNVVVQPPSANTLTAVPSVASTLNPINTPTPTNGIASAVDPNAADYIDDRSTPSQVIVSYFNAVNRKEYARAYSYWRDPSNSIGSFSSFVNGYNDTASVTLVFGSITGDPSMSQIHYTVPVILKATLNTGTHTKWTACYIVHEVNPGVFGAPPFEPMSIDQGSANQADINADDNTLLANACGNSYTGSYSVPVGGSPLSIDKNNFLDNRSGPIETVSSLFNALNLKQYVRAYYYFKDPSNFPGTYDSYAAGFADTEVITAAFGTVQNQGAAGTLYYKVPLAMKVLTTSSTTQTFIGCYTLSLLQPGAQVTPPFKPLGIIVAHFRQVDNNTDINAQLPTACN